jgi:hypothetical protein
MVEMTGNGKNIKKLKKYKNIEIKKKEYKISIFWDNFSDWGSFFGIWGPFELFLDFGSF